MILPILSGNHDFFPEGSGQAVTPLLKTLIYESKIPDFQKRQALNFIDQIHQFVDRLRYVGCLDIYVTTHNSSLRYLAVFIIFLRKKS